VVSRDILDLRLPRRRVEMIDVVSTGLHASAVVAQLTEKRESIARRSRSFQIGQWG
jgi:hypothetical protein